MASVVSAFLPKLLCIGKAESTIVGGGKEHSRVLYVDIMINRGRFPNIPCSVELSFGLL